MYHFTVFKCPRSLHIAPVLRGGVLGEDQPKMYVTFLNGEVIVANREGKHCLFHIRDIHRENDVCMVGYCVEGEDAL